MGPVRGRLFLIVPQASRLPADSYAKQGMQAGTPAVRQQKRQISTPPAAGFTKPPFRVRVEARYPQVDLHVLFAQQSPTTEL